MSSRRSTSEHTVIDAIPAWSVANLVDLRARAGATVFDAVLAEVQHILSPRLGILRLRLEGTLGMNPVAARAYDRLAAGFKQLHPDSIADEMPAADEGHLWLVWITTADGEYGDHRAYLARATTADAAVAEALAVPGAELMPDREPAHQVNTIDPAATVHEVKSWPKFFNPILAGTRVHELRENDRGYAVGDVLHLREYDPETRRYTGREHHADITSMTSDEQPCAVSSAGLSTGYAILSIARR
jgi:hypothetical protein